MDKRKERKPTYIDNWFTVWLLDWISNDINGNLYNRGSRWLGKFDDNPPRAVAWDYYYNNTSTKVRVYDWEWNWVNVA